MTDTTRSPSAIEMLEAQGPHVPADQAGKYAEALSMLKGLDYRSQAKAKREAAAAEGQTR